MMTTSATLHKMQKIYKPFKTLNEAFARAVRVWVCKSCNVRIETNKPELCTTCGGKEFYYFASRREANRYGELRLMMRAGLISGLETQINFPLYVNEILIATYRADFVYWLKGKKIVEDVKGTSKKGALLSESFKFKKKLMQALYNIDVKVVI